MICWFCERLTALAASITLSMSSCPVLSSNALNRMSEPSVFAIVIEALANAPTHRSSFTLGDDFDINKYSADMLKCYYSLISVHSIGDTSASKILHLFAPNLIVMWDKNIPEIGISRVK